MLNAVPAGLTIADEFDSLVVRSRDDTYASPVLCTSWDPGSPQVREAVDSLVGVDGSMDATGFTSSRPVALELQVYGDATTSAYAYAERLAAFTHPTRRPFLYAERAEHTDYQTWRMLLRGQPHTLAYTRAAGAYLPLTLAFNAPDGYWESPLRERIAAAPDSASTGLTLPSAAPWVFGGGSSSYSEVYIPNAGSVPVSPVLYVYGPATDPAISSDLGHEFAFDGLTLPAGSFVQIDMAACTVRIDAAPASSAFHLVDWSRSTFWRLQPGANTLRYTATSGVLAVHWRDRRYTI